MRPALSIVPQLRRRYRLASSVWGLSGREESSALETRTWPRFRGWAVGRLDEAKRLSSTVTVGTVELVVGCVPSTPSVRRFPRRYRPGEGLAVVGEEMFINGEGILTVDRGRRGGEGSTECCCCCDDEGGCRLGMAESSLDMCIGETEGDTGPAAEGFTECEESPG